MSSAYYAKAISKTKAEKRAYEAFKVYYRTLWTITGSCLCYTCDKVLVLKKPGQIVTIGHWVEGHSNVSYINPIYVRPQCVECNVFKGGLQGEFRDRIRKELGNETVDRLLMEARQTKDISVREYLDLQAYYKVKLQELAK